MPITTMITIITTICVDIITTIRVDIKKRKNNANLRNSKNKLYPNNDNGNRS